LTVTTTERGAKIASQSCKRYCQFQFCSDTLVQHSDWCFRFRGLYS